MSRRTWFGTGLPGKRGDRGLFTLALAALTAMALITACPNPTPTAENPVAVAGVSLNEPTLSLDVDGTETLIATVNPPNATDPAVTWSSNNINVATVDTNGTVTAWGPGSARIIVTTANGKTASCTVTVTKPVKVTQPVTGITFTGDTVGTAKVPLTLSGKVQPDNATNQAIVWTVEERKAGGTGATISGKLSKATLSTTGGGKVTVTATIANGTAVGTPYTQDFDIIINPPDPPARPLVPSTLPNLTMIPVPAGSVTEANTGSGDTINWGAGENDKYHKPWRTLGFKIGATEITWELWKAVYDWATDSKRELDIKYAFANPGQQGGGDENSSNPQHPVTSINWGDAVVWCNAYSEAMNKTPVYYTDGTYAYEVVLRINAVGNADNAVQFFINEDANGFRLPTEAEWEYAARGGDPDDATNWNYKYAGSDAVKNVAVCNINDGTAQVKSKTGVTYNEANSWWLYDMSGNVREWCQDRYPDPDPEVVKRVMRGGGWSSNEEDCTVAHRGSGSKGDQQDYFGFRVVCRRDP